MIIYDLSCSNSHRFEGWFSSRADFEEQLSSGMIRCPLCGVDRVVEKPSAPAVHVGSRARRIDAEKQKEWSARARDKGTGVPAVTHLKALTEAFQQFLSDNFEDVGGEFSNEAIAIYLGDTEPRNISGTATPEEERELEDLGVPFGKITLPRFDD